MKLQIGIAVVLVLGYQTKAYCFDETKEGVANRDPEICDGIDNDGDGLTDEDLGFGAECTNSPTGYPEGECDEGLEECIDAEWQCNANWPMEEVCDGLDNNCDGTTDGVLDVPCPGGSQCFQGECKVQCNCGECCNEDESIYYVEYLDGQYAWLCLVDVCDPDSPDALPCVFNPYWCDEGWDPLCTCSCELQQCLNICEFITCPDDTVCIPSDGTCQTIEDNCWIEGCMGDRICVGGECVGDPCFNVECENLQYCNNNGECVDPCFESDCTDDQGCYEGECVDDPCVGVQCNEWETCNHETGQCEDGGACGDVVCLFYEVCVDGECVEDPCWNLECPNGFQCIFGACYEYITDWGNSDSDTDTNTDSDTDSDSDTSDADTGPQASDYALDNVLATGIGGCLCTTTPGAGNFNLTNLISMLLGLQL